MSVDFVDTHCHIHEAEAGASGDDQMQAVWLKDGKHSPDEMIRAAREAGVTQLICVGTTLADSKLAIDFVQKHENCWVSIGVHPHEAEETLAHGRILPEFAALMYRPKIVAIGECGLDYYYQHSSAEDQLKVLRFQLELAQEADLPVIFHVREAFDDFWPIFEEYSNIRGVLHSFTDSKENMERAIAHGLFIGVNGIATFAKNPAQLDVYKSIPLQNLLLETDAPFLTPTPYRGTINEPKYVRVTATFLSNLRGEKLDELAVATTQNAQTLFGLTEK